MLKIKRKFSSRKKRLHSASSSTAGSVSDMEDRVVMLCEDIPAENSFDSGRGSRSIGARSSQGSHMEPEHESGSEPHFVHLSRDRLSYRQACYVEKPPASREHKEYYIQRVVQVYEYLSEFTFLKCIFLFCIVGTRCTFITLE